MNVIVDYGMGNLRSVQKALERVGHSAQITRDAAAVASAERVILPGVGASADALAAVRRHGLEEPIKEAIASGRPFLGICLGLQMLLETSHEDGVHRGLGVVPGDVVRFDLPSEYKVPHMGWNRVRVTRPCPLFEGVADGEHFYFVHSYHAAVTDPAWVAAEADYGGPFCAAIARGAAFATQFHPEKSQAAGMRMLKNFAELRAAAPA